MEGESCIRVKKLIILFIPLVLLFTSCSIGEQVEVQPFRMQIMCGGGLTPCSFDVSGDGTLTAISGIFTTDEFVEDMYDKENYSRVFSKSKKLSKKERGEINNLVSAIKENGLNYDEYNPQVDGGISVYAKIDGVGYSCVYEEGESYYLDKNSELRALAHKLVEISPIKKIVFGPPQYLERQAFWTNLWK